MTELSQDTGSARLDAVFHALSDARRRGMIEQLSEGPQSVKELAKPFQMTMPTAVKHLAVLENSRLVSSQKRGRVRTFELSSTAFSDIEAWVEARKRRLNMAFDRLEAFLEREDNESGDE